jgi:hypothetical protein
MREGWEAARLLPTAGIRNQGEQERRAASALLAVMSAVPDFCHGLLSSMKAPKGKISTYTELRFKDEEEKLHIPDGAVVIERGKKRWSCLVEIKTGGASLGGDQVSRYLDLAVLTEAIVQHRFRGIEDPDQAWILGELIRYLDDEKSGASGFDGMGSEWVRVRESARNGTLRASDPQAEAIAARWEQFVEYLCLHLSQELGVDVKHLRPRGKTPAEQVAVATQRLASKGAFSGSIEVPDAVGPIGIEADLRARLVTTSVEVPAPKEGRPKTRINWLLRQLKDAPDDLRIDVQFNWVRTTRSELLRDCREAPELLVMKDDPKREPRTFVVALSRPMGKKDGRKEGSFVAETQRQVTEFYRDLVQGLMPPRTKAPKIKEKEGEAAEPVPPTPPTPQKSEVAVRRDREVGLQRLAELMPFESE